MKLKISIILLLCLFNSIISAQELSRQGRSAFFLGAFEAGIASGDLYNEISDSPFQFGFRAGFYGIVSEKVAIGGGLRGSVIPFGNNPEAIWGFSGGPELVILGNPVADQFDSFTGLYMHYMRQSLRMANTAGGVEIGGGIGGMKVNGGVVFGVGAAFDIMSNAPDGVRVYLILGFTGTSTRPNPSN